MKYVNESLLFKEKQSAFEEMYHICNNDKLNMSIMSD